MLDLAVDETISKKRKSQNAVIINEREVTKLQQDLKDSNKHLQEITNQN